MISSEWAIKENSFFLTFSIPENAVAKIIIPEAYQNRKYNVWDLIKNKKMDVSITHGEFDITSGKFLVMAK
jgi:hypothetical protein